MEKPSKLITENGKTFREMVKPNTFRKALNRSENVYFYLNHDESKVLGSIKDGNLKLYEDSIGLKLEATIDNNEEIRSYIDNNKTMTFSYGFIPLNDSYREYDGVQLRELNDIELIEVSLLTNKIPAYDGTLVLSAEKRCIDDKPIEYRELIVDKVTEDKDNDIEARELESMRDYYNLMKYYIEKL